MPSGGRGGRYGGVACGVQKQLVDQIAEVGFDDIQLPPSDWNHLGQIVEYARLNDCVARDLAALGLSQVRRLASQLVDAFCPSHGQALLSGLDVLTP